jgi:hypothetical protein
MSRATGAAASAAAVAAVMSAGALWHDCVCVRPMSSMTARP